MNEFKGKTIKSAKLKKHSPDCDSENVLSLNFTDGTSVEIVGGYGGFTGKSCDEYIEVIDWEWKK